MLETQTRRNGLQLPCGSREGDCAGAAAPCPWLVVRQPVCLQSTSFPADGSLYIVLCILWFHVRCQPFFDLVSGDSW